MLTKKDGFLFTPLGWVLFLSIGPFVLWGAIHASFFIAQALGWWGRFIVEHFI